MGPHNPPPAKSKGLSPGALVVLWLSKLAAGGILGYAAWLKLTDNPHDIALFRDLNWEPGGRYLIGGIEIVAAILILIPQSAIYGSFLGLGIMCGAIIGHLSVNTANISAGDVWKPLLVGALCVLILYIRRHDAKFIRNLWER